MGRLYALTLQSTDSYALTRKPSKGGGPVTVIRSLGATSRRAWNLRLFLLIAALRCLYSAYKLCIGRVYAIPRSLMYKDPRPLITFSGGGFKSYYYFGIAIYLRDHFDIDCVRLAGISGGAAAIIALTMGLDLHQVLMMGLHSLKHLKAQGGPYLMKFNDMAEYIGGLFEEIGLTDADVERTSSQKRAFMGVTQCSNMEHRCLNVPATMDELIDLYLCTQCIMPFYRSPGTFQGKYYVDGGLSAFWSVPDGEKVSDAITVTCLPSNATRWWPQSFRAADVQPDELDLASIFIMYPFSDQRVQIKLGYEDAKKNHQLLVLRGLRELPEAPITEWREWEKLFASVDDDDPPPLSKARSTAAASAAELTHDQILRTYSESDLQAMTPKARNARMSSLRRDRRGSQSDGEIAEALNKVSFADAVRGR